VIGDVLVGWCTLHGLVYFALVVALFWAVLYAHLVVSDRRTEPAPVPLQPKPLAPSWASATPVTPAGSGRPRTPGSTR
jgi:hypothetical protein